MGAREKSKRRVQEMRLELSYYIGRGAKARFFDENYGKMFWKEHDRYENLWQTKTEDPEFTEKLENYLKEIKNKHDSNESTTD